MGKLDKNEKNEWNIPDSKAESVLSNTNLVPVAEVQIGDVIFPRMKVTSINPCPGQLNRTHLHLNAQNCYDSRSLVRLVKE